MAGTGNIPDSVVIAPDQEKEGYWVQETFGNLQVWHHKNQIALLMITDDINQKVQDVIERRRKDLQEVFEKTGWKPEE